MSSFYNHPIGKALSWAVHEQNSGAGNIKWHTRKIRDRMKELSIHDSTIYVCLEYIDAALKQQQKGMDKAYEAIKKRVWIRRKVVFL